MARGSSAFYGDIGTGELKVSEAAWVEFVDAGTVDGPAAAGYVLC